MSRPSNPPKLTEVEGSAAAFLQPMRFVDILDTMFSIYRKHFRLFASISAIYFVIKSPVVLLIGSSTISFTDLGPLNVLVPTIIVVSLIGIVIMLFVIGGIIFGTVQAILGEHVTVVLTFRQTKHRFLPCLGYCLLYLLVVGLLTLTIVGIPAAFYLGVRWIFGSVAALVEGNSTIDSLRRSSELVKGAWWRVFGIISGVCVLALAVHSMLQLSLFAAFSLTDAMYGHRNLLEVLQPIFWDGWVDRLIYECISLSINSLMLPIPIIGATLVYFDQRIRKGEIGIGMLMTRGAV